MDWYFPRMWCGGYLNVLDTGINLIWLIEVLYTLLHKYKTMHFNSYPNKLNYSYTISTDCVQVKGIRLSTAVKKKKKNV